MTFLGGDEVPPEALGVLVRKASGTDRASTTTVTADPHLTVTVGPGTWQLVVRLTAVGDGGDIKINWATSGAAIINRWCRGPAVTSTDTTDTSMRSQTHGSATEVPYGTLAGVGAFIEEVMLFTVAASATLTLQWAQNSTDTDPTTLGASSHLIATLIEPA